MPELAFADGVLFFPVTAFSADGSVDAALVERHVSAGVDAGPGGVFAVCGTGEFHALALDEYEVALAAAVVGTAGRVPVVAGAGGPLGHAIACARAAERLGAQGLLLMPPYLVSGPQHGLLAYVEAVLAATSLPVIVYHRGTASLSVPTAAALIANPRVVGIKDGVGDVALAQTFVLEAQRAGRADLLFFNGLLTAELSQAAYRAIGVPLYSSAVFAMAPEIANAFYRAYVEGDDDIQRRLLDGFYAPLVRLRDETPGFAVALIKAGLRLAGLEVGPVRPPLADPDARQTERLRELLAVGHELAGS
jgi:5-dehydro-4-deoxyglucarate dehydratase